jgi:hypothetical protein
MAAASRNSSRPFPTRDRAASSPGSLTRLPLFAATPQGDEYIYGPGKIDAGDPNYNSEEEVGIRAPPPPASRDSLRLSRPEACVHALTVRLCRSPRPCNAINAQGDTTLEVSS